MTPAELRTLLDQVRDGRTDAADAYERLQTAFRDLPFEDLGFAKVDHQRSMRQGFAEVILGLGKTPAQIASIAGEIVGRGHPLLVTRTDEAAWQAVRALVPEAEYHELARAITGTLTIPATTLGKAPSMPATTMITRADSRRARCVNSR